MTLTAVIVDDHGGFRAMACQMLEDAGFEVVGEAFDGAGAVEKVAALQPDLVLLDVQLPDIDGFTVAADLSRTSPGAVVVLTSVRNADDYGQARVAATPIRRFIAKAELSGATLAELAAGTQ
ncbi:MAG TPA: response regulator [Acidimicrobiales bacterium]|nr:response regulator [Acidimicrobiales bacterium]